MEAAPFDRQQRKHGHEVESRIVLRTCNRVAVFLLLFSAFSPAAPVSISEYRRQLHNISQQVAGFAQHPEDAGKLTGQISDELTVTTASGEVIVNLRYLKDDLARLSAGNTTVKPRQIESYVRSLEEQAAEYESDGHDLSSSRLKLNEILSRREFSRVHDASAKETFLSKIYGWLARLWDRIHLHPNASSRVLKVLEVLVYALLGAALLLLLLWTLKRLRAREEQPPQKEIMPFSPSARGWRSWLADAREFGAKQDWRSAIHLAYWAGISFLESGGAWKPNRARTPREYLRLVSTRNVNYAPLKALTRRLELVWYGHRDAGEQDFNETLGELEKLGCR